MLDIRICKFIEETDGDIYVHLAVQLLRRISKYEHFVIISSVSENTISIIKTQMKHFCTPHIFYTGCKYFLGQD
jgi:hypothetical protein